MITQKAELSYNLVLMRLSSLWRKGLVLKKRNGQTMLYKLKNDAVLFNAWCVINNPNRENPMKPFEKWLNACKERWSAS